MGKDLDINNKIQTYIQNLSQPLHPIQKEVIATTKPLVILKECKFLYPNVIFFI